MLTPSQIGTLLEPYLAADQGAIVSDLAGICQKLSAYLELILKWNARMSLTAIREPEEIVRRHFGESLFLGRYVEAAGTLLDLGSGAGFPGIPVQLLRPQVRVTLAESQGKKVAFLREVVRELGIRAEVWDKRVEHMPLERRFDAVALRAVDRMEEALKEAGRRSSERILILETTKLPDLAQFRVAERVQVPGLREGVLLILTTVGKDPECSTWNTRPVTEREEP